MSITKVYTRSSKTVSKTIRTSVMQHFFFFRHTTKILRYYRLGFVHKKPTVDGILCTFFLFLLFPFTFILLTHSHWFRLNFQFSHSFSTRRVSAASLFRGPASGEAPQTWSRRIFSFFRTKVPVKNGNRTGVKTILRTYRLPTETRTEVRVDHEVILRL